MCVNDWVFNATYTILISLSKLLPQIPYETNDSFQAPPLNPQHMGNMWADFSDQKLCCWAEDELRLTLRLGNEIQ